MGQATAKDLIAAGRTLKTQFFSALEKSDMSAAMQFMTEVNSNSDQEDYGWLGATPGISEWLDERQLKGLAEYSYSLKNKKWEGTLQVKKEDLEDEKTGQLKIRTQDLATRAANHRWKYLNEVIIAGATQLAYDGQYYFDTDHAYPNAEVPGTQSNKLTGTGTTLAQVKADFIAARKAMKQFNDDRGEIFHEMPLNLVVMCPVDLEVTFEELLNATLISNTTNTLKGAASLVSSPYLSDVNDWYLFNVGSFLKPFIFQNRMPIEWHALDNPEQSDSVFMRDAAFFGTRARYAIGYGLWQNAILTTNT